jgi:LacI family transcriptional regulator
MYRFHKILNGDFTGTVPTPVAREGVRSVPTISDVAKRAGVSPATVSRVLQGAANVRPTTRERVEKAIDELGYVPSAVARSLRSKRTRSLALVVPDITNTFWTTVARGVEDVAQQHDYSVLLGNTDEDPAKQKRYLDFLVSQQVDGVIIAPYDADARNLGKLRQRNIPTVLIDRRIEGWDLDSVLGDSLSGARAVVQHLVDLGHRRIAILSGPTITSTAEDRVAGYCLALVEAGIDLDPRLIKRGEYRSQAGEALARELLDEELGVTAIFAANNAIAMGAISTLEERGLQIPQDIALVSFDDLPNTSQIFPFLTVVTQPVYDMGMNAAQLLLSRLGSDVRLRPRHVVLPVRLVVRHSCGSQRADNGGYPLSLPLPGEGQEQSRLVRALSLEDQRQAAQHLNCLRMDTPGLPDADWPSPKAQSAVNRLIEALQHRESDRVPHIEVHVSSQQLYEYILEHEVEMPISPEDEVEFALRLGMDAVFCHFTWRPGPATDPDGVELASPPSLVNQISTLERYLRATQGTNVGVIASFTSFFDNGLEAAGSAQDRARLKQLMDTILEHQVRVMRVVCDRFAADLALVMIWDDVAGPDGPILPLDLFVDLFKERMARLIAPAREHGKLLLMHSQGNVAQILPILHEIGFHAIHPLEPAYNDIFQVKDAWAGKLALVGNVPTSLLAQGSPREIDETVRAYCARLAPGGGYVLSSDGEIGPGVSPENLVAMTRAVHKYGHYREGGFA